jgi:hypothetical protein
LVVVALVAGVVAEAAAAGFAAGTLFAVVAAGWAAKLASARAIVRKVVFIFFSLRAFAARLTSPYCASREKRTIAYAGYARHPNHVLND